MAFKDPKQQPIFMHDWYLRNKDKVRQAGRNWRATNPEKQMIVSARARAKKFKVPFAITFKDIIIPEKCPILGIHLVRSAESVSDNSPSLDRIIPSRGYVPGNIQVISNKANAIKRNATSKEIRMVADWLEQFEKRMAA